MPPVVLVSEYAGSDGSLIRHAVDDGAKGLVIDGVGAGNVNAQTYQAIKYALGKNIPVVVTSSVPRGSVYPAYGGEGGGATMQSDGVIMGSDLGAAKARLLLMLGIPYAKGDKNKLGALFAR